MTAPRLLLVDDDRVFRRLLRGMVQQRWPAAQVTERDPIERELGDADFRGEALDVVLLDYQLGPRNGFDYLRRFRQTPGFPPVIMLTGEGNERLAVEAIKLGASDYIPKQAMTAEIVVAAIQAALDARGAADRLPSKTEGGAAARQDRHVEIKGLRILRTLGTGGMATVHLAERVRTGEQVVLKVFDQDPAGDNGGEAIERFSREYDIVRALSHPGVVRIYEQGFTDDHAYITMEYFPDGSLRERLRRGLDGPEALACAAGLCAALDAVHAAGVIHRDLKPPNVMFRADGTPVLIDFGVAKALSDDSGLTRAGTIVGTPHYASPEQVEGRAVDARSDLYSLGIMLFEMLTGFPPYTARTPMAVLYKHCHAPPPELPAPWTPLQPLLQRLLAKSPDARFASAAEARTALLALPADAVP